MRRKLSDQLKKIQHISNLYKIEEQEHLSQWLTKNSCAESVFFCNSGAEANESAIKLIKKYGNSVNQGKEKFWKNKTTDVDTVEKNALLKKTT